MGDLSPHFSRSEFACQCRCGFDTVDAELLQFLEAIRQHFDQPVKIESGCRCVQHNRNVGGSEFSRHLIGRAADIKVKNINADLVAELARQMSIPGVGGYDTFTHIDTRTGIARWIG